MGESSRMDEGGRLVEGGMECLFGYCLDLLRIPYNVCVRPESAVSHG